MTTSAGDDLLIVPTGTANVASIRAAFLRLGVEPRGATTPDEVAAASRVVVPGVGSFGAAMGAIDAAGMRSVLRQRIDAGRPTLAVCVGMQLLGDASTESPGVAGLGAVSASVSRFPAGVRVPQLGWNRVEPTAGTRYLTPGWAYFANSYRYATPPLGWPFSEWTIAVAEHGGEFVAAMERGAVLAVQFHPELSAGWGAGVIGRWLDEPSGVAP